MVNAVPEPIILPVIFNDEFIVDAPETNKLVKFVLFNNDVDVAFKLLIEKVEFVDKLFKLLNIVFCVPITLFKIEFIANTDKPDVIILPTTFNVDIHVDALFKVVVPDIFNEDMNVEGLFKLTIVGGFNIEL